jgi:transcriptional regulator with XRE-family HTH domain
MAAKRPAELSVGLRFEDYEALQRHLGRRLAEVRRARGVTQVELADAVKLSPRQIQTLEGGTGGGSLESWLDLAEALDVGIETFFRPAIEIRAREPQNSYKVRSGAKRPATEAQIDTLVALARAMSSKEATLLLQFIRSRKP